MNMKVMETERLLIRPFTLDDVEDVHREVYSSAEVWGPRTREQVAEGVQLAVLMGAPFAKRAVVLRDGGMFVGQIRLDAYHNYFYRWEEEPDPPFNPVEVELSFAFGKQFWGKGYAFEASQAMIHQAFEELKLPRLLGGTGTDNQRSINLHRHLGYRIFEAFNSEGLPSGDGIVTVLNNNAIQKHGL